MNKAKRMIETFEQYLGRIEITGRSGRIERVYFEIRQSHIDQWEKPQIKDSKRSFLHSVVNEGGDKEKLESFVNFCEDTIYEMQHSQRISGEGEGLRLIQVPLDDYGFHHLKYLHRSVQFKISLEPINLCS